VCASRTSDAAVCGPVWAYPQLLPPQMIDVQVDRQCGTAKALETDPIWSASADTGEPRRVLSSRPASDGLTGDWSAARQTRRAMDCS
jgi:hypothetical protein